MARQVRAIILRNLACRPDSLDGTGGFFVRCESRNPHEYRRLLRKVTPKVTPAHWAEVLRRLYAPGGPKVRRAGGEFWCHYWCHFVPKFGAFWCDAVRSGNPPQVIDNNLFIPSCAGQCNMVQKGGFLDSKSADRKVMGVRPPLPAS